MAQNSFETVIIPASQIKRKLTDDDIVQCTICTKRFASERALSNHVRMEHTSIFETGDSSIWTTYLEQREKVEDTREVRLKIVEKTPSPVKIQCKAPKVIKVKSLIRLDCGIRVKLEGADEELTFINPGLQDMTPVTSEDMKTDTDACQLEETPVKQTVKPVTVKPTVTPVTVKPHMKAGAVKVKVKPDAAKNVTPVTVKLKMTPDSAKPKIPLKVEPYPRYTPIKMRKKVDEPVSGPFECLQPLRSSEDGICHRVFFECCEYSIHHREEHFRRKKGFRCQICEKPLGVQADGTIAPFSCHVCGVGYDNSEELTHHLNSAHSKERPYQCEMCLKRFTQQGGLQQHMRMHTGDRPFACTYCPKAFTQKSGLEQHLRIHTKVKPYKCVICEKSFTQSVHLKQHMRTHTNVTPFQCGICQKKFKQSSHLNYHLKSHHHIVDNKKYNFTQFLEIIEGRDVVEVPIDNYVEVSEDQTQGIDQEEQDRATSSIALDEEDDMSS